MGAENFSMTNTIRKDLESYNKNEVARPRFLLVIISSILIIQCASQNADKLLSEVVGKEFVDCFGDHGVGSADHIISVAKLLLIKKL